MAVLVGVAGLGLIARTDLARGATETFEYTGAAQSWTVPAGVTSAAFELYGAAGGRGGGLSFPESAAGKGARLSATLAVSPEQNFLLYVGGEGGDRGGTAGGFNGGGDGADGDFFGNSHWLAGGGGGASDLRASPALSDRVLVAAGGGGGGGGGAGLGPSGMGGPTGGQGGDSEQAGAVGGASPGGASGGGGGGSATTSGGGAAGSAPPGGGGTAGNAGDAGTSGQGGDGGEQGLSFRGGGGGGGGGGLFGGGGGANGATDAGAPTNSGAAGGGGGGGVSYAAPLATGVSVENGVRSGKGRIVVTYTPSASSLDPPPQQDPAQEPAPSVFDRTDPTLSAGFDPKQPFGSSVALSASCDERCAVVANGKLKTVTVRGKERVSANYTVRKDGIKLNTAGETAELELVLTEKAKKKARDALESGGKAKVKGVIIATDESFNVTKQRFAIKLTLPRIACAGRGVGCPGP